MERRLAVSIGIANGRTESGWLGYLGGLGLGLLALEWSYRSLPCRQRPFFTRARHSGATAIHMCCVLAETSVVQVDVYYLHSPDSTAPLEEALRALLCDQGVHRRPVPGAYFANFVFHFWPFSYFFGRF